MLYGSLDSKDVLLSRDDDIKSGNFGRKKDFSKSFINFSLTLIFLILSKDGSISLSSFSFTSVSPPLLTHVHER